MLLAVGFASTWIGNKSGTLEAFRNFTDFLPPGSQTIVADFLDKRGPDVWKYALAALAGTLIGGTQVMKLLMLGIHAIYNEEEYLGFIHRQLRGFLLLLITMMPIVVAGILGALADRRVMEKRARSWDVAGIFSADSHGSGDARPYGHLLGGAAA